MNFLPRKTIYVPAMFKQIEDWCDAIRKKYPVVVHFEYLVYSAKREYCIYISDHGYFRRDNLDDLWALTDNIEQLVESSHQLQNNQTQYLLKD